MKKQGTYAFLPRKIQDRTSSFNPLSLLFNYESCYLEAHFDLRNKILSHRKAARFSDEVLATDSSWFNPDLAVAFEDINANSHFLSPQKKPRQPVSMNDFRVMQFDHSSAQWSAVRQLEMDLGDFLLKRNELFAEHRVEHLNDPLNFFFMDVKRIIRLMVREKNTDVVLDTTDSLLHYINYVETELAFDSQDRVFIGQVRDVIQKKIMPQVKGKVGSDNLKLKFETLMDEIDGVIDSSNRELHFSFQDYDVNPHAVSLLSDIDETEQHKHPLRAFMGCAESKKESNALATKSHDTPLFEKVLFMTDSVFNLALLESCQGLHLMPGLSAEEKQSYVDLTKQVSRLIEFKSLFKSVLNFFDEVGQYHVITAFQQELRGFLTALKEEIEATKHKIEHLISSNQEIKNKLLSHKLDESIVSQTLSYFATLSGLYTQEVDIEGFMRNQDIKHITSGKTPMKAFDSSLEATDKLLLLIKTWQTTYQDEAKTIELTHSFQNLIKDIKAISGMVDESNPSDLPKIGMPDDDFFHPYLEECNYVYDSSTQQEILFCDADLYQVSVYPKFNERPVSYSGDTFLVDRCYESFSENRQGMVCDGTVSTLFYQPMKVDLAPKFFEQLGGQVALGAVMFKLGEKTYEWLFQQATTAKPFLEAPELDSFKASYELTHTTKPVFSGDIFQYKAIENQAPTFFKGNFPSSNEAQRSETSPIKGLSH